MTIEQKRALLKLYCLGRSCSQCIFKDHEETQTCYKGNEDVEKNFKKLYRCCSTLQEVVDAFSKEAIQTDGEVEQTAMPLHDVISTDENEITLRVGKNVNAQSVTIYFKGGTE